MKRLILASVIIISAAIIFYPSENVKPVLLLGKADSVHVVKSERTLSLFRKDTLLKTYTIALGQNPVDPKVRRGDMCTPEGKYIIDYHNPNSSFHLSLHINYPTPKQIADAKSKGTDPGDMIMIHGLSNGMGWLEEKHRLTDWTHGCIAVTNEEIEEIYNAVPDGTPITILH